MSMLNGIDISEWQTGIDYTTLSKQIDFVILREGYRQARDKMFTTHVNAFKALRVPIIGVYHFIYALNRTQVIEEAKSCIKNVESAGLPKTTRIWADFEYDTVSNANRHGVLLGPDECNSYTKAFCETIKQAGYPTGIYTNEDYARNMYTDDLLRQYPLWYAQYDGNSPKRECMVWQYSSKGKLSGFGEDLDMNYLLSDEDIKKEGESMTTTEKAIRWMEALASDNSHGYDQIYRWGEKGDYDCSSAVITAWETAGVPVKSNGATYTGNMYKVFTKYGFKDVTSKVNLATGAGLKRADVLLNHVHHVAMYCGAGYEVEASINERGTAKYGQPGDQTGREILRRTYRNYPWDCVLRYEAADELVDEIVIEEPDLEPTGGDTYMFTTETVKNGSSGASAKLLQKLLRGEGYYGANGKALTIDGQAGTNTIHALQSYQRSNGLVADGICGPLTWAKIIGL